jgi:FixJ family two-component response regulator
LGLPGRDKQPPLLLKARGSIFEQLRSDQHKVLELVVTGLLNKQIADKLGTCETTLKIHRGQVMRKCDPDRWQNDLGEV